MVEALARVPSLETAGIRTLINGPEAFTPDGNFILGEAPEVRGFFVGAGFNAFGIASGGGAGKALAEWVVAGEPPMDLWPVDIRRFGAMHRDESWVRRRTLELYGKHYTIGWPHEEHESGRPLRVSPLYQRLKERGACFGSKWAGSAPTGSPRQAPNRAILIRSPAPTGSGTSVTSIAPRASASPCSTNPRSPSFS
jgi:4-methylaminobutanoate oxidase (formaldehyde-forming)